MFRLLIGVLWASVACVDVAPLPIDGQIYECTLAELGGPVVDTVEVCGALSDWRPAAAELRDAYPDLDIDCRGTRRSCDYEED